MKRIKRIMCQQSVFRFMVITVVSALLVMTSCGTRDSGSGESIAEIQKREGVPVTVLAVKRGLLRGIERAGGTIEGYAQAVLSGGVPGTLARINARMGARVNKDELLAVVKPDYGSGYDLAKAAYENAVRSRDRIAALAEEGGVSREVGEQVDVAVKNAALNLEMAHKSENIFAPFAGTVVEIMEPLNSKVGPGQALIKLADLRRIRIRTDINESLISAFARGQKAFIVTGGDTVFGVVDNVSLGAKNQGHMFSLDVVFDNSGGQFRPGIFVTVNIITVELPQALGIPAEIVLYDDESPYVYVVRNNVARMTRIKYGMRGGDLLDVTDGLDEGDLVVVAGASLLSDGVKVKVIERL